MKKLWILPALLAFLGACAPVAPVSGSPPPAPPTVAVSVPTAPPSIAPTPTSTPTAPPSVSPPESAPAQSVSIAPTPSTPTPSVSPSESPESSEPPTVEGVTVYIEGPDGVLADTLAEGAEMTALEALQAVCEAEDVALEVSGAGMFAYVKAIGGCREFDSGPLSGWIFKVNGVHSAKGVGSVTVKAGDRVSFYYSLDMGQDVKDKP